MITKAHSSPTPISPSPDYASPTPLVIHAGSTVEPTEPEFAWNNVCTYFQYWATAARSYVVHRLSPTRIRKEWNTHDSHTLIQVVYGLATFLLFFLLFYYNGFAQRVDGYYPPTELTCFSTAWGGCGLNAGDCQPFELNQWQAVRCPHRCTLLDTKDTVYGGDRDHIYMPNSRICNSALHAGVIDYSRGGCFLLRPAGAQNFFEGGSSHGGIDSQEFPSWYPSSMQLIKAPNAHFCSNFGEAILVVAIVWLFLLALIRPRPMFMWYLMVFLGYWYVLLTLSDRNTQVNLFWIGTEDCIILAVFAYVLYYIGPFYTLRVPLDYEKQSLKEFPFCICSRKRASRRPSRNIRHQSGEMPVQMSPSPQPQPDASEISPDEVRRLVPPTNQIRDASFSVPIASAVSSNLHDPHSKSSSSGDRAITAAAIIDPNSVMSLTQSQQSGELGAPLMSPSLFNSSPSPSPSPTTSPPSVSTEYHPPTFPAFAETEIRRRPALPTLHDEIAAHHVSIAPVHLQTSKLPVATTCRPWYELYFLYICPFLLAIHFSYVAYIPGLADIDLTSAILSHGGQGLAFVLIVGLVVLVVVIYIMKMAFRINILFRYLLYYAYLVGGVIFISLIFPYSAKFHLHHLLAGLCLLPMTRFTSKVTLVFQAIAAGIFINGLAVWHLSTAWDVRAPSTPSNPFNRFLPVVFQTANATASTVEVAWPVYTNRSDAIGTTLFLNGIEIYHSTYDLVSGGGHTPFNWTMMQSRRSAAPTNSKTRSRSRFVLRPTDSPGLSSLSFRSTSFFSLPSRSTSVTSHIVAQPQPHPFPAIIAQLERHDEAVEKKRVSKDPYLLHPLETTNSAIVAFNKTRAAASSAKAMVLSANSYTGILPMFGNQTFFFHFLLNNLVPNTSYAVQAGYLMPNGGYNMGPTLIVETDDSPP